MSGDLVDITNVPEPVFSQKMMGDGIAIVLTDGVVVSPVDGVVINVFKRRGRFLLSDFHFRQKEPSPLFDNV
ncbi:MAG: PTS glucose transporter subunit IIA [Thermoanaerobacter sp.]|nr:PTS glucose transporter subunit IIA [Thermoanaerobacter sp.]